MSEAGGLGLLNTNRIGDAPVTGDPVAMLETARAEIQKIKTLTSKPFGIDLPYVKVDGFFDMVLEELPNAICPRWFEPDEVEELRDAGVKMIGYVSGDNTLEEVKEAAENSDFLLVKGNGCGGHMPHSRASALSLMQQYRAAGIDVPMVPGGGIANGIGAAAMAGAGAEGVWIGSRFIASVENPAADVTKQAIVDLQVNDMLEFGASTSGWLLMSITPKSLEIQQMYFNGATPQELGQAYAGIYDQGMLLGHLDEWMINVGDSVDSITDILTCKEIVDELGDAFLAAQKQLLS